MSYLQRIAERLGQRRVMFAQPRPPELSEQEQAAHFLRKYIPVRFVAGAVLIGALLMAIGTIALIVGILCGVFG